MSGTAGQVLQVGSGGAAAYAMPDGYRHIARASAFVAAGTVAGTYALLFGGTSFPLMSATPSGLGIFPADPAYIGSLGTIKYRLYVGVAVNGAAPAVTITTGLYPVSASSGGSGALIPTVGTVTSGSTVAFASPASGSVPTGNSGDFTAPVAGSFIFGAVLNGTTAASSGFLIHATLLGRAT